MLWSYNYSCSSQHRPRGRGRGAGAVALRPCRACLLAVGLWLVTGEPGAHRKRTQRLRLAVLPELRERRSHSRAVIRRCRATIHAAAAPCVLPLPLVHLCRACSRSPKRAPSGRANVLAPREAGCILKIRVLLTKRSLGRQLSTSPNRTTLSCNSTS